MQGRHGPVVRSNNALRLLRWHEGCACPIADSVLRENLVIAILHERVALASAGPGLSHLGRCAFMAEPEQSLAKSKRHGAKSTHFIVEVQKGNLVVSLPSGRFRAVYYKAAGRPHLILRERSKTDDHELLADAFQAAVAKARELGWIT
jgi:hypothetical protein